ncbi:MAG: putative lipid II flippase FtsW [Alphaproteobacteria bacterium]|nr:putative lipid II flippase FtsW [Alphaproteobacteria bacterium]
MRQPLDRRNTTALGRWWFTVDRTAFLCMMALICIGFFLVIAGSPPVARRLGYPDFYFVSRHQIFLGISALVMVLVSMMDPARIRKMALLGFAGSLVLLLLLPVIGYENKGAVRWIHIAGQSIQPSEFMKPCLAVVLAWIFSLRLSQPGFPSYRVAMALYALVAVLLIIQPDFGMTVTITGMFGIQLFLAGISFLWVGGMVVLGLGGMLAAYYILPHVASRIDRFLDPSSGDNYQVEKSLEAFKGGGWFGRGPGEGVVKQHIPDSHTDFIFSVAGEEFGLLFCLLIVLLFAVIVVRGFLRMEQEPDSFRIVAVGGLLAEFGIQSIVNMGVAVNLLPAKGMTLPFLSYGGSSLIAMAGGMGMMLALTRKRYGQPRQQAVRAASRYVPR